MRKELKKQAKGILRANYSAVAVPTVLIILINISIRLCTDKTVLFYSRYYLSGVFEADIPLNIVRLLFSFAAKPIAVVSLFKAIILLTDGETDILNKTLHFAFRRDIIAKAMAINFVMSFLGEISYCGKAFADLFEKGSAYYLITDLARFALSIVGMIISYKLMAAMYYLAASGASARDCLSFSWRLTKGRVAEIFVLDLSFFGWFVLAGLIHYLALAIVSGGFGNVSGYNSPLLNVFFAAGYGIYLFFFPYVYITKTLYIKKIIGKDKFNWLK